MSPQVNCFLATKIWFAYSYQRLNSAPCRSSEHVPSWLNWTRSQSNFHRHPGSHLVSQVRPRSVPVEVLVDVRDVAEVGLYEVLTRIHGDGYFLSVGSEQHPALHVHDLQENDQRLEGSEQTKRETVQKLCNLLIWTEYFWGFRHFSACPLVTLTLVISDKNTCTVSTEEQLESGFIMWLTYFTETLFKLAVKQLISKHRLRIEHKHLKTATW